MAKDKDTTASREEQNPDSEAKAARLFRRKTDSTERTESTMTKDVPVAGTDRSEGFPRLLPPT